MSIRTATENTAVHASEADFEEWVLNSSMPVLVDFYADWCRPCRMLAPILDELASETTGARIVKVNVDRSPRLAARYGIRSIPCLMVFEEGKVVRQHPGLADKVQLRSLIENGRAEKPNARPPAGGPGV